MEVVISVPCGAGSNGRQWRCAGVERAAGGVAGHTAAVEEAAGGMDLGVEVRETTHWGRADDMAAAAGSEHVGGPCQGVALAEVEGEGCCSSGLTSSVSEVPAKCSEVQ
jgi:hypothetical protein